MKAVRDGAGRTDVQLQLWALAPDTGYGAHAHTNACSATDGSAARRHFQNPLDRVSPSTKPAYANPADEIWLDLTTSITGQGVAKTLVPWQFHSTRRAKSVIIHAEHTHTGPADSGVAGARSGCLTAPF